MGKNKVHFKYLLPYSFAPGERNYCGICGACWCDMTDNEAQVTCVKCLKKIDAIRGGGFVMVMGRQVDDAALAAVKEEE